MPINLRELHTGISVLRSTVKTGQDFWNLLSEATIKFACDSNLLKGTLSGPLVKLSTGTVSLNLTLPDGRNLTRVERVEIQDPDDTDHQWVSVDESASVYVEGGRIAPDSKTIQCRPDAWALRLSTLYFPDPSNKDYPLRITYAWSPKRGTEFLDLDLPFPNEAEVPILIYAEYLSLRINSAGQDFRAMRQNLELSERALSRYKASLSEFRAVADTGASGCRSIFDFLPME